MIKHEQFERLEIMASALYNKHISQYAIGNSVRRCTHISRKRTLPRGTMLCQAFFRMPLGEIVAGGVMTSTVYYRLAVTGGTGVYANVGGQVQGITTRLRPHKENLVFTLRSF